MTGKTDASGNPDPSPGVAVRLDPPAPTTHRFQAPALNYLVATRCGLTVVVARSTQDDGKVTCGNCKRRTG